MNGKSKDFSVKSFLGFLFLCHPTNDSCALCVFWDIPLQALSEENKTFFNVRNMNISSHNEFKYHDFRISALQQAFTHTSWNTNPPQMSSITHSPEIRISNIILINTKIFSSWSQNPFFPLIYCISTFLCHHLKEFVFKQKLSSERITNPKQNKKVFST